MHARVHLVLAFLAIVLGSATAALGDEPVPPTPYPPAPAAAPGTAPASAVAPQAPAAAAPPPATPATTVGGPARATAPTASAATSASATPSPRPVARLIHTPVGEATTGERVELELEFLHPELVRTAAVYVRRRGESAYRARTARRGSDGRWTVTLPRAAVGVDGFEYYVTLTGADGRARAAFASERDPHPIVVTPTRDDSQEAADLARLGGHRLDLAVGSEFVDFGARDDDNGTLCDHPGGRCRDDSLVLYAAVRYHFLRRVRSVGVRVERVAGRTTWGGAERDVGLVGATVDAELRLSPTVSLSLLGLLGANEVAVQPGAGVALSVGLGDPARLEATMRGMLDVGWVLETWMRWQTVPSTPLGAGLELTTQPSDNPDTALRLLMEIGRELGRHVTVTVKGGYGARNLEGGGLTLGGQLRLSL